MKHVAIIGNGIAGITAARYIRKLSDYKITVISAESEYFWSRTALMYIYMGHMEYHHTKPYEDWFWKKNKIDLIYDYVEKVDTHAQTLQLKNDKPLGYDTLILATGSAYNTFGWPGQDLKGVCGMVSLEDLKQIERYTSDIKRGVIVGGGLIGIELAEMLRSRNIEVTFLVREDSFWDNILPPEESSIINNHIGEHHIDLRLNTEIKEIQPDAEGRVKQVTTTDSQEIECQFVGITAGVHPQIDFLRSSGIELDKGILVDEYLRTNITNVFAIGDCAQHRNPPPARKNIEQIWYTGRIQGETVGKTICGKETSYNPGVFFNSAKFLDIEYQVYGEVPTKTTDNIDSFYWENKDDKKSIRITFEKESKAVSGFNLLGIRFRHELCDRWINSKAKINEVVQNLEKVNFDPEFNKRYIREIQLAFNDQYPDQAVSIRKRKKILGVF